MNKITKLLCAAVLFSLSTTAFAVNDKPFTIPEIKTWKGAEGTLQLSANANITYAAKDLAAQRVAKHLANDLHKMFKSQATLSTEKAKAGDITLKIVKNKKANAESYTIDISDRITITAPTEQGLFWATRTLLQLNERAQDTGLPKGLIQDQPDYAVRGFMLDCGRKYIPMRMLRQYVKIMAYYKMNTFHIHLNDNGFTQFFDNDWNKTQAAFRLESETYPGLTARDGHYTKKEFRALMKMADSLGVTIIPEIDVPAHSLAFTRFMPEIGSKEFGADHLDIFKPETYTFLDGLFKEYLEGNDPVFAGKYVHIGTDEYSNKTPELVEKFRYFTDRYIKYVESFGKKAMIWGSQTHAKGNTPIKVKDVLMSAWSNDYANPDEMLELGYNLISIPDGTNYIVPLAGYYHDYLKTDELYKNWTPANINGKQYKEQHAQILGGMFAVWNDLVGNGISLQDIHYRTLPALQTLATKMWTGAKPTFNFDTFDAQRLTLSEAPGVNFAGKHKAGIVLQASEVKPRTKLHATQIGWNYEVSFDIDAKRERRGTILFCSKDATFYLSDPISGKLGFARDGYLSTFNYQFFPGEKAKATVKGNTECTYLYVNGQLVSALDIKKINFGKRGDMWVSHTLVFPLSATGNFKSTITNLEAKSLGEK